MINYSLYESSFVFAEWEEFDPEYEEIKLNDSSSLLVEYCDKNSFKIVRLISSDPLDYLNPDFVPGSIHKNNEIVNRQD